MWSEVNKKCEFCILGTRFFFFLPGYLTYWTNLPYGQIDWKSCTRGYKTPVPAVLLPCWSSSFWVVFIFGHLTFWVRSSSILGEVVFHFWWGCLPFWGRSSSIFGEIVFHSGWSHLPFWMRSSSILGEVVLLVIALPPWDLWTSLLIPGVEYLSLRFLGHSYIHTYGQTECLTEAPRRSLKTKLNQS